MMITCTPRPRVLERDIDTILTSCFLNDARFGRAFVSEVVRQSQDAEPLLRFDAITVDRQARHAGAAGTIDLLLRLWWAGRECGRILVENKIDSAFTPDQPERYAASAAAMSTAGRPALAVLCAPGGYLDRSRLIGPFHARLGYELLAGWLTAEDKATVLDAVARFEMPYEPDPIPEVAEFFSGYRALARCHAPDLIVRSGPNAGDARPSGSHTIYFDVRKTLPSYGFLPTLRFSHQCQDSTAPSASVKIMIAGWAAHERAIRGLATRALENTPIYVRPAGNSLGLVIDTPRLDNRRPVSQQAEKVLTGLRAAATLRAWMFENRTTLHQWQDVVAG